MTALCLHGAWLLAGAGTKGCVEVWEPRAARRVGVLAGAGGPVATLAVADESVVRSCGTAEGGTVVLRSRAPMRFV